MLLIYRLPDSVNFYVWVWAPSRFLTALSLSHHFQIKALFLIDTDLRVLDLLLVSQFCITHLGVKDGIQIKPITACLYLLLERGV